jgi:nitrite reductase/ring-hydroxylating ferredoxin subunit
MLSASDNTLLTQVGPGTPMGNLFRQFWLPALLEEELPAPDCAPVKLRLLGEDLVAFRDTENRIGVLDAYCAHRRVNLFFGRNEEGGIRCVYHGWKYDVNGRCVDVPSEPFDNGYTERVRLTSYRAELRGGVLWVYMGDPANAPPPPDFEWSRLPFDQRTVTKRLQRTNWAQGVEGGIDSSHVSFLHHHGPEKASLNQKDSADTWRYMEMDTRPVFVVDEADHGLSITARRNADPGVYYCRVTQFLLPAWTLVPPTVDPTDSARSSYYGHCWVPIDDEHCWTWTFHANPYGTYTQEDRELQEGPDSIWGPVDAEYHPLVNMFNGYGLDREKQRHSNYTGITGIQNQDAAVQESMGPVVDRSKEILGHSDLAIVRFRRLLLQLVKELAASGTPPAAARDSAFYNIRPATLLVPEGVPVMEAAAPIIHGAASTAA